MLNSDRALVLASAAGSALEDGLFRDMPGQQRFVSAGSFVIQVVPHSERDLFRVENLSGVVSRAMLRTAPALDARIGLERDQLRDVLAGIDSEVFVSREWWDVAKPVSLEE